MTTRLLSCASPDLSADEPAHCQHPGLSRPCRRPRSLRPPTRCRRKLYSHQFHGHLYDGSPGCSDLFFVISGIVISTVTVGKFGSPRSALTFLYHRFARIYPIFWFYFAIVLAIYLHSPSTINGAAGHHVDLLRSFFLIPNKYANLLGPAWSLSYEVYFYLVFFLLLLLATEHIAPIVYCLWGGAIILCSLTFPAPSTPLLRLVTSPFIIEFLAGCLLFQIYHRFALHPRAGKILLLFSLVWLTAAIVWTRIVRGSFTDYGENAPWERIAFFGTFAFLFLLGAMELERSSRVRFARPFEALGDLSYSIYLSHLMVVQLFGRSIRWFAPHLPFAIFIVDALAIPSVILVGFLSYTRIERPLMRFFYMRSPKPKLQPSQPEQSHGAGRVARSR